MDGIYFNGYSSSVDISDVDISVADGFHIEILLKTVQNKFYVGNTDSMRYYHYMPVLIDGGINNNPMLSLIGNVDYGYENIYNYDTKKYKTVVSNNMQCLCSLPSYSNPIVINSATKLFYNTYVVNTNATSQNGYLQIVINDIKLFNTIGDYTICKIGDGTTYYVIVYLRVTGIKSTYTIVVGDIVIDDVVISDTMDIKWDYNNISINGVICADNVPSEYKVLNKIYTVDSDIIIQKLILCNTDNDIINTISNADSINAVLLPDIADNNLHWLVYDVKPNIIGSTITITYDGISTTLITYNAIDSVINNIRIGKPISDNWDAENNLWTCFNGIIYAIRIWKGIINIPKYNNINDGDYTKLCVNIDDSNYTSRDNIVFNNILQFSDIQDLPIIDVTLIDLGANINISQNIVTMQGNFMDLMRIFLNNDLYIGIGGQNIDSFLQDPAYNGFYDKVKASQSYGFFKLISSKYFIINFDNFSKTINVIDNNTIGQLYDAYANNCLLLALESTIDIVEDDMPDMQYSKIGVFHKVIPINKSNKSIIKHDNILDHGALLLTYDIGQYQYLSLDKSITVMVQL